MSFSNDGSFLAAGENAFKSPEITIWKVDYQKTVDLSASKRGKEVEYTEIKHLRGHKYGIECLKFAPNNAFLISLGDP